MALGKICCIQVYCFPCYKQIEPAAVPVREDPGLSETIAGQLPDAAFPL